MGGPYDFEFGNLITNKHFINMRYCSMSEMMSTSIFLLTNYGKPSFAWISWYPDLPFGCMQSHHVHGW